MRTIITYGIKFTFEELYVIFKLKNLWNEDYEEDPDLLFDDLEKIFTDIPVIKYHNDDIVILGFDMYDKKSRDCNTPEILELGNLNIPHCISNKLDMFLKNNNIEKEKVFFLTC